MPPPATASSTCSVGKVCKGIALLLKVVDGLCVCSGAAGADGADGVLGRAVGAAVWKTVVVVRRIDCTGVGSAVAWLGTAVTNCLGDRKRDGEDDSTFAATDLLISRGDGM